MLGANLQFWQLLGGGAKRLPCLRFGTQQHAKEATDRERFNLTESNGDSHGSKNGGSSGTQLTTERESEEVHT